MHIARHNDHILASTTQVHNPVAYLDSKILVRENTMVSITWHDVIDLICTDMFVLILAHVDI
jgi:hypothetical protein